MDWELNQGSTGDNIPWTKAIFSSFPIGQRAKAREDTTEGRRGTSTYLDYTIDAVIKIGALAHIAKQAFNSIGRLNVPVHGHRKLVKGQQVLFIFSQTSHRLGRAFAVFGFEDLQLGHGFLFGERLLLCLTTPSFSCFSFLPSIHPQLWSQHMKLHNSAKHRL
jgi:hypothetical protein